jgi:hypothetical protein
MKTLNLYAMHTRIDDIASQYNTEFMPVWDAGWVHEVCCCIGGSVDVETTIGVFVNQDDTADATITIPTTAVAGDTISVNLNVYCPEDGYVRLKCGGEGSNSHVAGINVQILR